MQRLEVSGAVRLIYRSLGVKGLNAKLNPISHLLALLGAHHILHVSRRRVKETSAEALRVYCSHHNACSNFTIF